MRATTESSVFARDICGGLLWALGLDLVGTSVYVAVVASGHPALALIAVVGVSVAAVSVGMAVAALQRDRPSPRLVAACLLLALAGLAVNTVGSVLEFSLPAAVLLVIGDALAAVYIFLEARGLRLVRDIHTVARESKPL